MMQNAKRPPTSSSSEDEAQVPAIMNASNLMAKDEIIEALAQSILPKLTGRIEKLKTANRILNHRLIKAKMIYKRISRECEVFPTCFLSGDDGAMSEDDCHLNVKPDLLKANITTKK